MPISMKYGHGYYRIFCDTLAFLTLSLSEKAMD